MTARLAHLGDTHIREGPRAKELQDVLDVFLAEARKSNVELIVHSGDFFDGETSPADRLVLAHFLERASTVAPVFGVRGNHDVLGDLALDNLLDTEEVVEIKETPTQPAPPRLATRLGPFGCMALPWFDKAGIVALHEATADAEQTRLNTIEAAGSLLHALAVEAANVRRRGLIPILAAHVMVRGSEVSTGQVIQGITVELSPEDILDVGAEYAALGHVHKAQEWFDGKVAYAGSPIRHNFGEREAKGWRLVEFDDDGRFVSNTFMPLPAREIVLIEHDWTTGVVGAWPPETPDVADALVRVRYKIKPEDLHLVDEEAIRRGFLGAGAADVKIEAVIEHTARVRSEEIIEARSSFEKVLAYFHAKEMPLDDVVVERLRTKLSEIEAEAR